MTPIAEERDRMEWYHGIVPSLEAPMRNLGHALFCSALAIALSACGAEDGAVQPRAVTAPLPLEIHYINVGWGGAVFLKGPDGTTVLMEAGNTGKGTGQVVPYLQSIGATPAAGVDYTIAG